jgi:hypothetical protein
MGVYGPIKFIFLRDYEKNYSFIGQGVVLKRGWVMSQPCLNLYSTI